MSEPVVDFISPLNHLSAYFGNIGPDWSTCEYLDHIEWIMDRLDRNIAVQISLKVFQELWSVFQDAIQLEIYLREEEVFKLEADITDVQIQNLIKDTEGNSAVKFILRIDKTLLAQIYFKEILNAISGTKKVYLYFFPGRCVQYFSNCTLENLEDLVWGQDGSATTVLVLWPTEKISLFGPRLMVLGNSELNPKKAAEINSLSEKEAARINSAYDRCRTSLKWQEVFLHYLTPWHLAVTGQDSQQFPLQKILYVHFGNTFLLYSADLTLTQTVNGQQVRFSRFNSPDKNIEIQHFSPGTNNAILIESASDLNEVLNWIYDPQWPIDDRLTLAQINIVDAIAHFPEGERFAGIFQQAANIMKNILWHWETFTHKKIEAYFGVVKDYENYLSQVALSFATDIAAIQKTLSDTLLAAVAVLIASFIASLFKEPFNPFIFKAGMTIYAIYILAIPLLYNMIIQWKKYRSYQEQRDVQKKRLSESLPDTKIKEIWDAWKIDKISTRFERVFWVTIGIYSLVIILMLIAAWLVPTGVLINAVKSGTPTFTPTVPPTIIPIP